MSKNSTHEQLMRFARILASYGCAGVGQDADDTTLCGKCGPCEANAFLRKLEYKKGGN